MKYLAILVFLVILHEGAFMSIRVSRTFLERSRTHASAPALDGYEFIQGVDVGNLDITKLGTDLESLRKYCDSTPDCLAFNTNGYVKKNILPEASWNRWTTDPSKGTYVKVAFKIPGYRFVQGQDVGNLDITKLGADLKALTQFCDSRTDCLAFNTNGYVKKNILAESSWNRFSTNPRAGTYIKIAFELPGYQFVQGQDSNFNDITNLGADLQALKSFCDGRSDCLGFNTNGYVKNDLLAYTSWNRFSENPRAGTYVKNPTQATVLDGYFFLQGVDVGNLDITKLGTDLKALAQFCDSRTDCLAFNTNGYVKKNILPRASWNRWTSDPAKGTYVKLP